MEKIQKHGCEEMPKQLLGTARFLSEETHKIWMVMSHPSRDPIAVAYDDHGRFMRQGYKVECCFSEGKRHGNAFREGDRFWFTERD